MTITDALTTYPTTFPADLADDEHRYDFELVPFDLYRDIHKGLRAELFAVTTAAGSVDPNDPFGRIALADQVAFMGTVLDSHAAHEDTHIDGPLRRSAPDIAVRIEHDHHGLEARFAFVRQLAGDLVHASAADARRLSHLLYLELSGFTGAYLVHQLVEERVVMPVLADALGVEAVLEIHTAIVSSIPPEDMASSLSFMLPAMNVDDRTELLGGMQHGAPPEAFTAVTSLARSVLGPEAYAQVAGRLGLA